MRRILVENSLRPHPVGEGRRSNPLRWELLRRDRRRQDAPSKDGPNRAAFGAQPYPGGGTASG